MSTATATPPTTTPTPAQPVSTLLSERVRLRAEAARQQALDAYDRLIGKAAREALSTADEDALVAVATQLAIPFPEIDADVRLVGEVEALLVELPEKAKAAELARAKTAELKREADGLRRLLAELDGKAQAEELLVKAHEKLSARLAERQRQLAERRRARRTSDAETEARREKLARWQQQG